ncbi:MAG: hypothetical protein FRX49_01617 [Trebouxia sp. A1-2]|nr:MAG: hypothetical protein FRX49_01617 [Trebouxia sp. A1-2]
MALTSFSAGQDAFAPFWNPTRDVAHGTGRSGRDMHLDVMEVGPFPNSLGLSLQKFENTFEIRADLPGMNKNDIQVHVDNDVVTVSVEKEDKRDEDKEEQGVRYHRMERSSQFIRRTVRMPETANLDQIKAKYDNGVLQLNIPKKEEERPWQRINVQ